ncbi:MAG TPA: hypothetical protein PK156_31230 [Polyangium sp.]|nr:hypothetical protein [Polyangium sp.]
MNDKKDELKAALVDVRRAYRLLHAYHRRLQDLLHTTHDFLINEGFQFEYWSPLNVARLPQSTKPFFGSHWGWDLTPGYQVQCIWRRTKDASSHRIFVHSIADTGYKTSAEGEPNPATFEAAETSRSEIRVGLYRTGTTEPDWGAAWNLLSVKPDRKNGDIHQVKVGRVEYAHRYFDVDLVELSDERAVKEKLLEPIGTWIAGS